ncbi:hypothetical protein PG993_010510 [Apiospora rasikravindrae]|uniref:Uncharacterized protein n=1 Tax=Apiospora rasikravindrae TaxID=990691 RepID=A0ABR1SMH4_9PEZI
MALDEDTMYMICRNIVRDRRFDRQDDFRFQYCWRRIIIPNNRSSPRLGTSGMSQLLIEGLEKHIPEAFRQFESPADGALVPISSQNNDREDIPALWTLCLQVIIKPNERSIWSREKKLMAYSIYKKLLRYWGAKYCPFFIYVKIGTVCSVMGSTVVYGKSNPREDLYQVVDTNNSGGSLTRWIHQMLRHQDHWGYANNANPREFWFDESKSKIHLGRLRVPENTKPLSKRRVRKLEFYRMVGRRKRVTSGSHVVFFDPIAVSLPVPNEQKISYRETPRLTIDLEADGSDVISGDPESSDAHSSDRSSQGDSEGSSERVHSTVERLRERETGNRTQQSNQRHRTEDPNSHQERHRRVYEDQHEGGFDRFNTWPTTAANMQDDDQSYYNSPPPAYSEIFPRSHSNIYMGEPYDLSQHYRNVPHDQSEDGESIEESEGEPGQALVLRRGTESSASLRPRRERGEPSHRRR